MDENALWVFRNERPKRTNERAQAAQKRYRDKQKASGAQQIRDKALYETVKADPDKVARRNAKVRERNRLIKLEMIRGYGGKCRCCGETRWQFLSLDHVNGGGTADRRSGKSYVTTQQYAKVIKAGFPPEFQLLCLNCNCAKGYYGVCPHESEAH